MDPSMTPVVPPFRRRLFGYDRAEVDVFLDMAVRDCQAQLAEAQKVDVIRAASTEIAALLRTFAESVAVMHDDAEHKASTVVADAEAEATRVRNDSLEAARAVMGEADAREADSQRVLREAQSEADRILDEARQKASALLSGCSAELDTRFKAIAMQRMMTEQEVARAAEHLAGVLSALRSLDRLPVDLTPPPPPAEVPPEAHVAVDLNQEDRGFSAILARWADKT